MDNAMCAKTEDYQETISHLLKELSNKEKDAYLAAAFGKELLEENDSYKVKIENYSSKVEILEQENYSLLTNLESKTDALKNHSYEIEFQRDRAETLQNSNELLEKEISQLKKTIKDLNKQEKDFKKNQENLQLENSAYKKRISLQSDQLKEFQDQLHVSICEPNNEFLKLQSDLNVYMIKNKELQDAICEYQFVLDHAKMKEDRFKSNVIELQQEIVDKDTEISAYSREIKETQDEISDLQAQIEALKFEQVDVGRRGNSVFAELDDRRLLIEKEYKTLKTRFQNLLDKFEDNRKELQKTRSQMALLLGMASRKSDTTYIEELENVLFASKKEVEHLTNKLIKQVKDQHELLNADQIVKHTSAKSDCYDYLRVLLQQSQEKIKSLENELIMLRTSNLADNDKLSETQRLLYKADKRLDAAKGENVKLRLKISELLSQTEDASAKVKGKPNVELLPGFEPNEETEKILKQALRQQQNIRESYIMPCEVELKEDGFVETKPQRMSNRWALYKPSAYISSKADVSSKVIEEKENYSEHESSRIVTSLKIDKNLKTKVTKKATQRVINTKDTNCAQQ